MNDNIKEAIAYFAKTILEYGESHDKNQWLLPSLYLPPDFQNMSTIISKEIKATHYDLQWELKDQGIVRINFYTSPSFGFVEEKHKTLVKVFLVNIISNSVEEEM